MLPLEMDTLEISEPNHRDSRSAAELSAAAFASMRAIYRPKDEVIARQQQYRTNEARMIAKLNNQVVGTVEVASHRNHLRLMGLAVHPDFRRMGIARRLIDWISIQLKRPEHRKVMLATIRETGNVAIFQRMGFEPIAESIAQWCVSERFEHLHEVTMEKSAGV